MPLVEVFRPTSEPELMAVVAMLEARQIPCHVQNSGYGSPFPGLETISFFQRVIMVPEERASAALELIRDFQNQQIYLDPAWRQRRMLSGSKRQRDSGPALGQFQERYTVAAEDLSRYVEKSTAYEAIRTPITVHS